MKKEKNTEKGKESLQLSVLDVEKKYSYDLDEVKYSSNPDSWISWGLDNNLPTLYRNCYLNSATLKACIDGTIDYVLGDAVIVNPNAGIWVDQVNRTGMSMREFIAKVTFNLLVYGGFAIQVIYNKLLATVEMYPLDFSRVRLNETKTKVFYSKKWSKYQGKTEEYSRFNPKNVNPDNPSQIYVYCGDFTTSVYPIPSFGAALADVLTEIECARYSLNTVSRGFSAKYLFQIPEAANLTDEQKQGIEEAIKSKFTGSEANSFMLYWKDGQGADYELKIDKIESDDTPEKYISIKDSARQNIFIAMRATPLLFGLPNASNGFSVTEYRDSYVLFQKTVVEPYQDRIIEAIEKITNIENPVIIKPFTLDFETGETE